ncbi:MAG TPA: hypothetical protein VLY04_11485 [Bryobacteraceae bacterium]|nr:hypothetical protein [Bryobacteraceae bacterium]
MEASLRLVVAIPQRYRDSGVHLLELTSTAPPLHKRANSTPGSGASPWRLAI